MLRRTCPLVSIALVLSLFAATVVAATAQRTFVASTGNDANPCSLVLPCRGFTAAVAQTISGGEVIVLDSAGYGPVSIAKSISIIAPKGVHAGITATSGPAVYIVGVGLDVLVRGLTINGIGASSGEGIYFGQGLQLTVEDCEISNMQQAGIYAIATGSTVRVRDTVLRNNQGSGFVATGSVTASLERVRAYHNYPDAVDGYGGAKITVADSTLAHSVAGVYSFSNGGTTDITVTRSVVTGCFDGLWVSTFAGGIARIVADGNTLDQIGDKAFLFEGGGGTEYIFSPGNNTVGFNNGIVSGGVISPLSQH